MDFDNIDNIDQLLQGCYERALKRKTELEQELKKIQVTIEKLEPLFGKSTYSVDMLKAVEQPIRNTRGRRASVVEGSADKKCGSRVCKDKASAKEKKESGTGKRRVKQDEVREACIRFLRASAPSSRTGCEILDYLTVQEGYPATNSLRSRVYTLLGEWSESAEVPIKRISRGVYGLDEKSEN